MKKYTGHEWELFRNPAGHNPVQLHLPQLSALLQTDFPGGDRQLSAL